MEPPKSIVTAAVLRKAVEYHKTTGKCVAAVVKTAEGTEFVSPGDQDPEREGVAFAHCPVCGKKLSG